MRYKTPILLHFITSLKAAKQLENIIKKCEKIYIYGAGFFAYIFYSVFRDILEEKLVAFVDDNEIGKLLDKAIIPPEKLTNYDSACMLIAITRSNHIEQIFKKLEKNTNHNIISIRQILEESS